jgi:hypothetical protein
MSYDEAYVLPMIIAKLVSGIVAILIALLIYKNEEPKKAQVDRSAVKITVNAAPKAVGEKKNGAQTA